MSGHVQNSRAHLEIDVQFDALAENSHSGSWAKHRLPDVNDITTPSDLMKTTVVDRLALNLLNLKISYLK